MDTLTILAGSLVGQVCHIVKKRTEGKEEGESEWSVFRRWVLAKPINTLGAALVGFGVATGMAQWTEGAIQAVLGPGSPAVQLPPMVLFIQAAITGMAGNSAVNRPGKGNGG